MVAAVIGGALPTACRRVAADPVWPPDFARTTRAASGRVLADGRAIAGAEVTNITRTAA